MSKTANKSISTTVSLTLKESRLLTLKAKLAHQSKGAFIRRRLIFGKTPKIVYPDSKQYLRIFTQLASSARSISSLAHDLHKKQHIQEHLLSVSLTEDKKSKADLREQLKKSNSFIKKTITPELDNLANSFVKLDKYIHRQLRR